MSDNEWKIYNLSVVKDGFYLQLVATSLLQNHVFLVGRYQNVALLEGHPLEYLLEMTHRKVQYEFWESSECYLRDVDQEMRYVLEGSYCPVTMAMLQTTSRPTFLNLRRIQHFINLMDHNQYFLMVFFTKSIMHTSKRKKYRF